MVPAWSPTLSAARARTPAWPHAWCSRDRPWTRRPATWHWLLDSLRERTNPWPLLLDYRAAGARRVLTIYRIALHDRAEDKLPRVTMPALVVRG